MSKEQIKKHLQSLDQLVGICPICQAPRQMLTTQVINRNQAVELLHIACGSCRGAVVALIYHSGPMISSIGLITDLSSEDIARLQHQPALQEDDIINLHVLLRQPNSVQQLLNS